MLLTVAILDFDVVHFTDLTFAFLGFTVAFSVTVFCLALPYTFRIAEFLFIIMIELDEVII